MDDLIKVGHISEKTVRYLKHAGCFYHSPDTQDQEISPVLILRLDSFKYVMDENLKCHIEREKTSGFIWKYTCLCILTLIIIILFLLLRFNIQFIIVSIVFYLFVFYILVRMNRRVEKQCKSLEDELKSFKTTSPFPDRRDEDFP